MNEKKSSMEKEKGEENMTTDQAFSTIRCACFGDPTELSEAFDTLKKAIESQQKTDKTGHWIPVSEGLPEKDGCYFVTEKSGRVCTYVFHKEGNSEEYWKRCAVAWMPLPEPYKEESEG